MLSTAAPYLFAAAFVLLLALFRGWRILDWSIDRTFTAVFILAAAVVAGSFDLGTDVEAYREYYTHLRDSGERSGWWEPGFELLALLFASTGAPYGLFVFACVLGSHLIKLYVYDRSTHNTLLAFFVLFCLNLGEITFVRQYVAASFILLSFHLLTKRRPAWAAIAILAAASFHKTALIAGFVVVLAYYGRASVKPLAVLGVAGICAAVALPTSLTAGIESRVVAQIAIYTAEGFVQGLQSEDVSLFRNYAKFLLYVFLAGWMMMLSASTEREETQRKAARVVLTLSVLSVLLIGALSPVFSRLSVYVFPFVALSFRADRFRLGYEQLVSQGVIAALLGANLMIALYPMLKYL